MTIGTRAGAGRGARLSWSGGPAERSSKEDRGVVDWAAGEPGGQSAGSGGWERLPVRAVGECGDGPSEPRVGGPPVPAWSEPRPPEARGDRGEMAESEEVGAEERTKPDWSSPTSRTCAGDRGAVSQPRWYLCWYDVI